MKEIQELQSYLTFLQNNPDENSIDIDKCERDIKDLGEQYKTAPEVEAAEPVYLKGYPEKEWIMFDAAGGRGVFQTMRGGNTLYYWYSLYEGFQWESWFEDLSIVPKEDKHWYKDLCEDFAFTSEQAVSAANKAIAEMGELDEFVLTDIDKGLIILDEKIISRVWRVTYSRDNNGLPFFRELDIGMIPRGSDGKPTVGSPWTTEFVYFIVDEAGIRYFSAQGLGTETMVLTENVGLLPFDAVTSRIDALLRQIYTTPQKDEQNICVTSIDLRSALISLPNEKDRGISIPVWHFTVTVQSPEHGTQTFAHCIDARDGAYIEPSVETKNLASYG